MSLIFILAVLSGVVADDFEVPDNVVYDTSTVRGVFVGFEVGDYVHPVISGEDGKLRSFWSTDHLMDYYLACNVGERVVLEIEEADSYIWEIEGMMRIFRVIGASAGTLSYSQWRDSLEAEGEPEDLLGDYYSAPYDYLIEEQDR
ncbi:MAG: hypothetical protein K8S24_08195 [Candidatus Aegiribacteria sp.]|nr:hypothetical protein [Candidatus Aegiribacteria sp.]